ncbi:hypothetical protein F0562_013727 [Nyssa sinensis]|uniref:Glutathione S-transferase n=1 Tax=Nyssa sinensis TaxID=561372 RepID=A0A5J4ZQW1_9ASTE|nr:hypothetical protein F0562_013727 [Nyssa sinensis]
MEDKVVLLDFWASPFGMRVKIALEEKGIKYECKEENLPEEKSSLLLQFNPVHKLIPVLIHNDKPICESLIILEYIDTVWKDKFPLLPSDPYQQSQARFWADFVEKKLYSCGKRIWMKKGEEQAAAKEQFIESLKLLEGELGEKAYFGGETMGLVDVTLVPHYSWFYTYDKCSNFNIEALCPKLVEWARRCMQFESVAKNLPDQQKIYDFVLEIKKKLGLK